MHLDKAPDAFRTISEVADELDIPQHVLRFWETRFTQIKPMKRSGGRRYYRPDDVDLLRGIRRLLYGEGYTIRGVQRILKEHGIKSVQALSQAGSGAVAFGPIEPAGQRFAAEEEHDDAVLDDEADDEIDADQDDDDDEVGEADEVESRIEPQLTARREPNLSSPRARVEPVLKPSPERAAPRFSESPAAPAYDERRKQDRDRLKVVLAELVACRQLLGNALKE